MAASNFCAYCSGCQHSQRFTQAPNPSIHTSYGAPQASTGYGFQASTPAAAHYVPQQTQAPRQVVQAPYLAGSTAAYGQQPSSAQGAAYGCSCTARQQHSPPPPPPTNTATCQTTRNAYQTHHIGAQYYDREAYETKAASYYSQQSTSNVQGGPSAYYAQNTASGAKASYPTSGTSVYPTSVGATAPAIAKTHPTQAYSSQSSTVAYPYPNARTQTTAYGQTSSYNMASYGGGSGGGNTGGYQPQAYDAAVYNAAAAFFQQQHHQQQPQRQGWKNKIGAGQQTPPMGMMKSKPPPKQPQLHYCDVCKISCAGPQTYKEHLEGQKHKKKEQLAKQKEKESFPPSTYRCKLCDVTCIGTDAYAAHLKGSKHQKVAKLHQKLGKPIPEPSPLKAPQAKNATKENGDKKAGAGNKGSQAPAVSSPTASVSRSLSADFPDDVSNLSVSEVGECLKKLNLGEYVEMFERKQIDGEMLVTLTDESFLISLGMRNMFDRRKLLKFIRGWRPRL